VRVKKSVGKPDAGNPHVRFDERGTETVRRLSWLCTRAVPRLYPLQGPVLDRASAESGARRSDKPNDWFVGDTLLSPSARRLRRLCSIRSQSSPE